MVLKVADTTHKNLYEELTTRENVKDTLREVEKLVKTIVKRPRGDTKSRPRTLHSNLN